MDYFELVRSNITRENFDLVNFLKDQPPTTTQDELYVGMKQFNAAKIRNVIIFNIFLQSLHLEHETCSLLIQFLSDDFSDLTKKIYAQVLVHLTKEDIERQYAIYSADFDVFPTDIKMSIDQLFNRDIKTFLQLAIEKTPPSESVRISSYQERQMICDALKSKPILSAFHYCFNEIMKLSVSSEWMATQIEEMQIYFADRFNPIVSLRGACLVDGILLCTSGLAGGSGTERREADVITISAHECMHYLNRINKENFNFSSPFAFNFDSPIKDLVFPTKLNFDAGRTVELLLFDRIQPDWHNSSNRAAETFLERLKTSEKWPVIKKDEHISLNLAARRINISAAFGIDVYEAFPRYY